MSDQGRIAKHSGTEFEYPFDWVTQRDRLKLLHAGLVSVCTQQNSFPPRKREEAAVIMSDYSPDLLVTDRRSTGRRRLTSNRKPAVPEKNVAPLKTNRISKVEVPQKSEPVQTSTDMSIEERREIIDRRHQDRRRQIDPTTCERDYSDNEVEFMKAMDDYKRKSGRPFPTWSEVLEVMMSLGYRKVADPSTMEWRTFGDQMGSL